MPDPKRNKNMKVANMKGVFNDGTQKMDFEVSLMLDKEIFDNLSQEEIQERIKKDTSILRFSPLSAIYTSEMMFQYDDPTALKDFDFGNILVSAHLPYCLHLPNHYEFEVDLPEIGQKVLLIHKKIWTKKAVEDGIVKSSEVDFFAKDKLTYFNHSIITTPKVPIDFDDGWEQDFTGRNVERIKDQNGTFRYSALYIQFDKKVSMQNLEDKTMSEKALNEIREIALLAVNRLIDSYRSITRNGYVQRLGSLEVNTIYFIDHNQGFYMIGTGFGIESATMNRSSNEIKEIEIMLETGKKPELYDLLLLDAETSLDNKDYALAVVQSFQALEIFLENLLLNWLQLRGDSDADSIKYLDQNWRTKERLNICLKELKNTSLYIADQSLWNKFCTLYDQTRNEIIHKGKEPNQKEVKEMLETNIKVITWLKTL